MKILLFMETGKQTRSFQYIDDLVEGMIRMMNTEDEFTGPVNLGNPNELPVLELARENNSYDRFFFENCI